LFNLYLDSKEHAAVIDDKVTISRTVGAPFAAFGGMLRCRNLMIVPGKLIVQSWCAKSWKKKNPDSILVLLFSNTSRGGQIELIHVGMPSYDYLPIRKGWQTYYWKPWKNYLRNRRSR
jgi:activator of HSP90 ATPase